jgi:outer membrane protein
MTKTIGRRIRWGCLALIIATVLSSARGQTNSAPARPISLEECIELALKENLDLQIERINPLLSAADIEIARAGYDPNFTISGQRNFSVTGGGLDANARIIPSSRTDVDSFNSGFTGVGPFGLNYNLSGRVAESAGTRNDLLGSIPFDSSSGSVGISLSQPLLRNFWTDATRYNIAVAKNRLKVSELGLQQQIMNVVDAVEEAYYELIFARENVKVQEKALQLAERLFSENKKRVEIGTLARLDEKQSESQVAASQADLATAQRSLATAQNTLKRLITTSYRVLHDARLDPTETLDAMPQPIDLQESWGKGMSQRPDLLQARLDLERQGITVKYDKNQMLPELNIIGGYGHGASGGNVREFNDAFNDFRTGEKPFWTVGGSFSIPLSNKAARNRYKQSKLTAHQLVLQLKKLEESALVQIDETVNQVRTSLDRVDSTRKARIYAEDALDAEQKKLASGKSTSFVVLQLQRDLTSARSQEIRALADYNQALSRLALEEGTTLERKKIRVDVK